MDSKGLEDDYFNWKQSLDNKVYFLEAGSQ